MKPSELKKLLTQLNSFDLILVLAYVARHWLRYHVSRLHPSQLALPVVLLQVVFFVVAVGTSTRLIYTLALGNMVIVALALIPILLPSPSRGDQIKAHWIKPNE